MSVISAKAAAIFGTGSSDSNARVDASVALRKASKRGIYNRESVCRLFVTRHLLRSHIDQLGGGKKNWKIDNDDEMGFELQRCRCTTYRQGTKTRRVNSRIALL